MPELTLRRPERTDLGGPPGLNDPFSVDIPAFVTVSSGPYTERLPVVGMTAGEVRRRFSERFDIQEGSNAIIDGDEVGDDTRLRAGQILTFMQKAGEKGLSSVSRP